MKSRGFQMSCSKIIIAILILGLALIVIGAGWIGSFFLERAFRNDALAAVERAGALLLLNMDNPEALVDTATLIQQQSGGRWTVFSAQGEALFGDPAIIPQEIITTLAQEGTYAGYLITEDNGRYLLTGSLLVKDGTVWGFILHSQSPESLIVQQRVLHWSVAMAALLLGALSWTLFQRGLESIYGYMGTITGKIYTAAEGREPDWPIDGTDSELEQLTGAVRFLDGYYKGREEKWAADYGRLDWILNQVREGVLLVTEMKRIVYNNLAAGELLGYDPGSLAGEPVHEAFRDYDLVRLLDQTIQDHEETEYRARTVLPSQKLLKANIYPLDHAGVDDPAILIILQDESEIEKLTQMRSEFVANVSHELRTPLTSIKGFAETILDGRAEDFPRIQRFAEIIENESDRLTRLIDDLLDLARIESGRIRLEFKRTSIRKVVQDTIEKLLPQLEKAEIALDLDIAAAGKPILADPDRLAQVIMNYVDNSLKYTHKGGAIRIRAFETDKDMVVEVTDNGVGIPAQDLERVFERFYRVDKARTRTSGGTGLGLAIVKHIIEAHGGAVFVRSTAGAGSTFGFSLPKGDE